MHTGRNRMRATTRRAVAAVGLAALTILATLAVGSGPVSAQEAEVDGCTAVPDRGYGFDFEALCDEHDRCYGTKPYGDGWRARRACDRAFRSAMYDHCRQHDRFSTRRISCDAVATAYYAGVRAFGWFYWQRAVSTPIA